MLLMCTSFSKTQKPTNRGRFHYWLLGEFIQKG